MPCSDTIVHVFTRRRALRSLKCPPEHGVLGDVVLFVLLSLVHVIVVVVQPLRYLLLFLQCLPLHVWIFWYTFVSHKLFWFPFLFPVLPRSPCIFSAYFTVSLRLGCSCFVHSLSQDLYASYYCTMQPSGRISSCRSCCLSESNIPYLLRPYLLFSCVHSWAIAVFRLNKEVCSCRFPEDTEYDQCSFPSSKSQLIVWKSVIIRCFPIFFPSKRYRARGRTTNASHLWRFENGMFDIFLLNFPELENDFCLPLAC